MPAIPMARRRTIPAAAFLSLVLALAAAAVSALGGGGPGPGAPSCQGRTATVLGDGVSNLLMGTAGPDVIVAGGQWRSDPQRCG
ncbi:MAG: hypothetical protein EXQ70_08910 [Solirubrobacterales bacterium]|nr:hypothetical protein [Solirubrobacterales bacterium]